MPEGNGNRDWREEMAERMAALEKARKALQDCFIVVTQLETKMRQLLKEQTEYIASRKKRLQEHADEGSASS